MTWILGFLTTAAIAAVAWGWFEAGWLRLRVLEIELEGAPPVLDGLRIAHLSDLHLGVPSRAAVAAERAVAWIEERRPDLVCLTGDLVSRRAGLPELARMLPRLAPCYVVLGNHDLAASRDPFSQPLEVADFAMPVGTELLTDTSVELVLRGSGVQLVGVDPRTYARGDSHPERLADAAAGLRILLCHFPGIARRLPEGAFHLVLSGHFHAGQIVVPLPGKKLRLAHLRAHDVAGVYRHGSVVLHVSSGIGTTFVPFRFFARPEVTELVVRSKS